MTPERAPEGDRPVDEERRRAFEAHRAGGGRDGVEAFVPPAGDPSRDATLEELVAIDLEFRWRAWSDGPRDPGDAPRAEDYDALTATCAGDGVAARIARECDALRAAASAPRELRPGARLGRYVLRVRAGRGAFAEVWRASDPSLRRDVAVKALRADIAGDPGANARFLREAQSAAALRHPGILAVHEVGTEGGRPYIVADFADGGTLADAIRMRRPGPREAAEIAARLADALDYAHACGVVHRDVKPGNVLLDSAPASSTGVPRVLLADFGLAALRTADATLTRAGEILGTPGYMAPEQVTPSLGEADARTDVYGLGALLYELLVGAPPFAGRSVESLLFAVVHEDPAAPDRAARGIPADLSRICAKAMSKDPRDRYETARTMAEDLRRHLAGEPVSARPPGLLRLAWMWARRRPSLAATVSVCAVAVAASVAIGVANVAAERRRTESQLYRSLVAQAEAVLASKGTDWHGRAMRAVADAARRDVPERDVRALRDLALRSCGSWAPSPRMEERWPGAGTPVVAIAPSVGAPPDEDAVAVLGADGRLTLRASRGGTVLAERAFAGPATSLAAAPGAFFVVQADGTCRSFDSATLEPRDEIADPEVRCVAAGGDTVATGIGSGWLSIDGPAGGCCRPIGDSFTAVAVSADGARVAAGTSPGWISILDAATGALVSQHRVSDPPRSLAFDAAGRTVLYCCHETAGWGTVPVEKGGGAPFARPGVHLAAVRWAGFDAAGRVVTVSADGTAKLWTADGGALGGTDPGPRPFVAAARSEDGTRFFLAADDGSIGVWRFDVPPGCGPFATRHAARFVPGTNRLATCASLLDAGPGGAVTGGPSPYADSAQVWGVATSPDGRFVATAAHDGAVRLRDARSFAEVRAFRESGPLAWNVAFCPDGSRTAAACGSDLVLFDTESGREIAAARHPGAVAAAAFHPGGRFLATACADGEVRLWTADLAAAGIVCRGGAQGKDAAFSPDGSELAVACDDGSLLVWRARGTDVAAFAGPREPDLRLDGGGGAAWAVAYAPDGNLLAAGTERGVVTLFARRGDALESVATLRADILRVRSLSFGGDAGRFLAAGCYVGASAVFDLGLLRESLRGMSLDWE